MIPVLCDHTRIPKDDTSIELGIQKMNISDEDVEEESEEELVSNNENDADEKSSDGASEALAPSEEPITTTHYATTSTTTPLDAQNFDRNMPNNNTDGPGKSASSEAPFGIVCLLITSMLLVH
jgi:hypothetical protein